MILPYALKLLACCAAAFFLVHALFGIATWARPRWPFGSRKKCLRVRALASYCFSVFYPSLSRCW